MTDEPLLSVETSENEFQFNYRFASVPTPDDPPIMLDEVWCEPTDVSIQDCSHTGVGNHDCFPHEAVGLVCLTSE